MLFLYPLSVFLRVIKLLASFGLGAGSPAAATVELAPVEAAAPAVAVDTSFLVMRVADGVPLDIRHELVSAAAAGMRLDALLRAKEAVQAEILRGGFPGAALAVGRRDQVVIEHGMGRLGWSQGEAEVDPDFSVYDIASLTKVVAATTAVMLLVEDGKMVLDAPVSRYLPSFVGPGKDRVTIRHLLAHNSGLPAGADIWATTPEGSLARAIAVPLKHVPGQKVEYSDIGFVVLWAAAEKAAEEPLFRLLDRRVFNPLGMFSTTFIPGSQCARCAPTARLPDGSEIRGRVHDPTARRLGGIAGNAGLFSNAHDLGRFAAMMANGGMLDGHRILREETIREFARRQPGAGTRALGWDTPARDGTGAAGLRISPAAYGHTGFTGTSLWIDPDRGTWTILLANRTYEPKASNQIQAVRRRVHDWVAVAVEAGAPLPSTVSAR